MFKFHMRHITLGITIVLFLLFAAELIHTANSIVLQHQAQTTLQQVKSN